jgi:hypothetical protein
MSEERMVGVVKRGAGRRWDRGTGLPEQMLVGVSGTTVYGFAARSRHHADALVFRVPRDGLEVKCTSV